MGQSSGDGDVVINADELLYVCEVWLPTWEGSTGYVEGGFRERNNVVDGVKTHSEVEDEENTEMTFWEEEGDCEQMMFYNVIKYIPEDIFMYIFIWDRTIDTVVYIFDLVSLFCRVHYKMVNMIVWSLLFVVTIHGEKINSTITE